MLSNGTRAKALGLIRLGKTNSEIIKEFPRAKVGVTDLQKIRTNANSLKDIIISGKIHRICRHCDNQKIYPERFKSGGVCNDCYNLRRKNNRKLGIGTEANIQNSIEYAKRNKDKINEKNKVVNLTSEQLKRKRLRDRKAKRKQRLINNNK